jgi:LmbE family N-acetylglucosaminyl deacetylase
MIELVNHTKPDVIVTWGPDGLTGHPRHVLVSNVVTRVFQQQRVLEHKPRKLYYIAYPESRFHSTGLPFGEHLRDIVRHCE